MTGRTMTGRPDNGIALVSVLWVSFLLTIIAASIAQTIRVQIQTTHNMRGAAIAEAMADGAVTMAALDLKGRLQDRTWRADGQRWTYAMPGGRVSVTVWDEGGKIDLNRADRMLLMTLFTAHGTTDDKAASLVDAIADWRDRDDATRLNGAEDGDYRQAGLDYGAKDGPFQRVSELRRVLGMTVDLYRRVAPALTVYSGQRGVDVEVAPPAVLRVLPGIPEAEISAMRESPQDSGDTGRLSRLREMVADRRLVTASRRRTFTVRAVAETSDGAVFVREAVIRPVRRGKEPFQVLLWARGRAGTNSQTAADTADTR